MDKLDILNRKRFVEQIIKLIENISDNKTSTCFAINGAWGSGKSFVLDMLEDELNGPYSEKYFVVRYNCWKYDYYEEPLIAIVSEILRVIDKKTSIIPDSERKRTVLGVLKATSEILLSAVNDMIESRTGIDVQDGIGIFATIWKSGRSGKEKYKQKNSYDKYFQLNKVIDKLSEALQGIAKEYTVVIIVDELDRCIPEYAIKVLERLHHLTEANKNIITVIAVDKAQLELGVRHLFGFGEGNKYLEKFFDFEVKLDKGEVSEKITEKYADYISMFDKNLFKFDESVEEYLQEIFGDIDVRAQEHIVKKAMLVHKLLFSDKKDYVFMCTELLITAMMFEYGYKLSNFDETISVSSFDSIFVSHNKEKIPAFSDVFKRVLEALLSTDSSYEGNITYIAVPQYTNLYVAIFLIWYQMHKRNTGVKIYNNYGYGYNKINDNNMVEELKKFAETLDMMK